MMCTRNAFFGYTLQGCVPEKSISGTYSDCSIKCNGMAKVMQGLHSGI